MPVTLKRKTGVSESDEEVLVDHRDLTYGELIISFQNIHTEKKAKTSRSFLDSEDAEDDDYAEEAAQDDNEDIEYSDEEEPDLTTRTKRNLKELDQITFDNMVQKKKEIAPSSNVLFNQFSMSWKQVLLQELKLSISCVTST